MMFSVSRHPDMLASFALRLILVQVKVPHRAEDRECR